MVVPFDPPYVPRDPIIGVMAFHRPAQSAMLHLKREVHVLTAPCPDRLQRPRIPIFGRDLSHHWLPFPGLSPNMGKSQKVEGGATRLWMPPFRATEAEVHITRLFGMEPEPVPNKTLAQNGQHTPPVQMILEAHDESSSPRDSHPQALTDTDVNLSAHPALRSSNLGNKAFLPMGPEFWFSPVLSQ